MNTNTSFLTLYTVREIPETRVHFFLIVNQLKFHQSGTYNLATFILYWQLNLATYSNFCIIYLLILILFIKMCIKSNEYIHTSAKATPPSPFRAF